LFLRTKIISHLTAIRGRAYRTFPLGSKSCHHMLRYKTKTRPGFVALYSIWPGNGVDISYNPGALTGLAA